MFSQIAISSVSGDIFTASSAHGLSYGSLIKVIKGSGATFVVNSLWLVLGSNLGSTTFSLSQATWDNVPISISSVAAVNSIVFSHIPMPISPKTVDSYPKISFGSIFDVHNDPAFDIGIGIRWSGFLRVPTRFQITFSFFLAGTSSASIVREKLRFYINGNSLINAWHSVSGINGVASFTGVPGLHYPIEIEYGSSFPLSIQCILFWKWDNLPYSQISPLYLLGATEITQKYFAKVLPSFVVPQQSSVKGFSTLATCGIVSFFSISTFDRFQNPSSLSSNSELYAAYVSILFCR
jgi:hypothetical protein